MGLNAEVVEIDTENLILYVQDVDEQAEIFGQRCALDCKKASEKYRLIYVDYESEDVRDISFTEFRVGDSVIVSMYESQLEGAKDAAAQAEQVQLGTQRDIGVEDSQTSDDLMDLEVSLFRDGYPSPVGPGSQVSFFREVYDGKPQVEVLEGWEPIYWPGAYWTRQSWDGFSALCYHVGEEPGQSDPDAYRVYTIDTTRTDLSTYRGIHVGSDRDEVLEAYPGIFDTHYWHDDAPDFPGDDYLWYCDNAEGWGAALLFFFEDDTVSHIRLNHMFN